MALLISKSSDDEYRGEEKETVPPLFASLFREKRGVQGEQAEVERAIDEALGCLEEDCFVGALGKFREAWALSGTDRELQEIVQDAAAEAASDLLEQNWRVAEALLREVDVTADALWAEIGSRKRADAIQFALAEAGRVDGNQYLQYVRSRLSEAVNAYAEDVALRSRLQALDDLLKQRLADEREKNLRLLTLFSKRIDHSENPDTWRRFPLLVAPFADAYLGDPEFGAVLDEVGELLTAWENAEALLQESRTRDCLRVCNDALEKRPGNILFRRLQEKAKGREWVALLGESAAERARAFEANGQYAEALEEWESLRAIDPQYPGLEAEIWNCAALSDRAGNVHETQHVDEPAAEEERALVAEAGEQLPEIEPLPFARAPESSALPFGLRISITEQAWNHFKTGLAATGALLLMVLVLASHSRR